MFPKGIISLGPNFLYKIPCEIDQDVKRGDLFTEIACNLKFTRDLMPLLGNR